MKRSIAFAAAFAVMLSGFTVSAASPAISASNAETAPGKTASIDISISDNPGIISLRVYVDYDSSVMHIADSMEGVFKNTAFGSEANDPFTFLWCDNIKGINNDNNGRLVTLVFEVDENAPAGEYPVGISFNDEDFFNSAYDPVHFDAVSGSIKVSGSPSKTPDKSSGSAAEQSSRSESSSKKETSSSKAAGSSKAETDRSSSQADNSSTPSGQTDHSSADERTETYSPSAASETERPSSAEASQAGTSSAASKEEKPENSASSKESSTDTKAESTVKQESSSAPESGSADKLINLPDEDAAGNVSIEGSSFSETGSKAAEEEKSSFPVAAAVIAAAAVCGAAAVIIVRKKRKG